MFGLEHVRASLQQVRRQAGRHFGEQVGVQRQALGQVARQAGSDQLDQGIAVLGHQAAVLGQADLGAFHGGARLAQGQGIGDADVEAALGEGVAFLVGLEGIPGQLQQGLVGLPVEVGGGHRGHQADLGAAARLFGGEVLLQRLLVEAAQAAEEVQLPGVGAEGGAVGAAGIGLAALAHDARRALAGRTAIG
ncbi:hypothetical protein D9M70_485070 [compost metagenome]